MHTHTSDYITALPIAEAVARALGPEYKVVPNETSDAGSRFARIQTPEGAVFSIEPTCYWRRDHFRVAGDYPRSKSHGILVYSSDGAPAVNISVHKKPEQIARDIKRRFLPDFLPVWEFVQERLRATEKAHDDKVAFYKTACDAVGISPGSLERYGINDLPIHLNGIRQGVIYGSCWISSADRVKFDLSTNAETAIKILSSLSKI